MSGREGPAPAPPADAGFGRCAQRWWKWAWSTPQSAAWSSGDLYALARRASLEDDLAALDWADQFDLAELLGLDEATDALKRLEEVIRKLKALAGGKLGIVREARELDERFGLTAKAMAQLRWAIVPDPPAVKDEVAAARSRPGRSRAKAVDADAVAGT